MTCQCTAMFAGMPGVVGRIRLMRSGCPRGRAECRPRITCALRPPPATCRATRLAQAGSTGLHMRRYPDAGLGVRQMPCPPRRQERTVVGAQRRSNVVFPMPRLENPTAGSCECSVAVLQREVQAGELASRGVHRLRRRAHRHRVNDVVHDLGPRVAGRPGSADAGRARDRGSSRRPARRRRPATSLPSPDSMASLPR